MQQKCNRDDSNATLIRFNLNSQPIDLGTRYACPLLLGNKTEMLSIFELPFKKHNNRARRLASDPITDTSYYNAVLRKAP